MHEYIGAIHMHTVYSDGSGTVKDIAGFADEVGLDYIIITDHNTLKALSDEGLYGNTLVLAGCEINDKENKNHYLAFGIKETFSTRLPAKEYVKKVKDAGGIGFLAHPHEKRNSMSEHPPFPWTEWDTKDFTGIEIWNHMSEWMEGLTEDNKYNYFVHPLRSIVSPQTETLKKWDELNKHRRVVGIGGIDAHAHKINVLGFFEVEVFPYKVLFKSIRTHILSEKEINKNNLNSSKEIIYNSLKTGNCFVSNYYHGDAKGFRFNAETEGTIYGMGENIPFPNNVTFRVYLPNIPAEIRLLKNGRVIEKTEDIDASFETNKKGAYRVEVYLEGKAWIFSNHIRIGLE